MYLARFHRQHHPRGAGTGVAQRRVALSALLLYSPQAVWAFADALCELETGAQSEGTWVSPSAAVAGGWVWAWPERAAWSERKVAWSWWESEVEYKEDRFLVGKTDVA